MPGTGPYDLIPVYIVDVLSGDAYRARPVRRVDNANYVGGYWPVRVVDPNVVGPYGGLPIYLSADPLVQAVMSFDGDLGTLFQPTDLGAKLKGWWNADDHGTANMTDDGAGLISSWIDRVSGIAATGATTARPTWGASSFLSSGAGVTFDGVGNALTSTAFTALPTGTTAGEIWILAETPAHAVTTILFGYGASATTFNRNVRHTASNAVQIHDGSTALTLSPPGPQTSTSILGGAWSGTTMSGENNGYPRLSTTITSVNTGTTRLRIGAQINLAVNGCFTGTIRHVIVTTLLSAYQQNQLAGWLAWDASQAALALLDPPHMFKYAQPTV